MSDLSPEGAIKRTSGPALVEDQEPQASGGAAGDGAQRLAPNSFILAVRPF
jgi:hypothetical protein